MEKDILTPQRRRPGRPRTSDTSSSRGTQSVERTLAILETLAAADGSLGFADIATKLELPTATAHRMLAAVVELGYVDFDENTGSYRVGGRLVEMATLLLRHRTSLRVVARPYLHRLVERTGETANMAVLDGTEASYVEQVESHQMVRAAKFLRVPLYCSSLGKSLLAFRPEEEIEDLIGRLTFEPLTERTVGSPEALRAELARVRKRGFSMDDEEIEVGSRCIAAPILVGGRPVAAISIAGPTTRVSLDKVEPLSGIVREVAEALSVTLAERFPDVALADAALPQSH
jgi:IclR family acetate operon transcriptional repressor